MPLAVLAFLTSIAYVPGIPSAAYAPRWWVILIGAPIVLSHVPKLRWSPGHSLGLLFFLAAALTMLWSISLIDSIDAMIELSAFAFIFWAASQERDLSQFWIGCGLGAALNTCFAFVQKYHPGFFAPHGPGELAGSFFQMDFFGAYNAIVLVGLFLCVKNKSGFLWVLIAFTAFGLLLSRCRGAMVAATAALLINLILKLSLFTRVMAIICLIVVGGALIELDYVFQYRWMAFALRLVDANMVIANLHLFGWGIGTLGSVFTFEHVENEFVELAFDMGILSLTFWAFVVQAFRSSNRGAQIVFLAILIDGLTSFPLHNPATGLLAAVVLGDMCAGRVPLRNIGLSRASGDPAYSAYEFGRRAYGHLSSFTRAFSA